MRIYNRKLKALLIVLGMVVVLVSFSLVVFLLDFEPLPNDGKLTLIDGKQITINADRYQLDLDTFENVGETQECVLVFRNDNSASAHTVVDIELNDKYFDLHYEPQFSVGSNQTIEYKISITLTDYPPGNADLSFSIGFRTEFYG